MLIPLGDNGVQPLGQMDQVRKVSDAQALALEDAEPLLHLVHPRAVDGRDVAHEARVGSQPGPHQRAGGQAPASGTWLTISSDLLSATLGAPAVTGYHKHAGRAARRTFRRGAVDTRYDRPATASAAASAGMGAAPAHRFERPCRQLLAPRRRAYVRSIHLVAADWPRQVGSNKASGPDCERMIVNTIATGVFCQLLHDEPACGYAWVSTAIM